MNALVANMPLHPSSNQLCTNQIEYFIHFNDQVAGKRVGDPTQVYFVLGHLFSGHSEIDSRGAAALKIALLVILVWLPTPKLTVSVTDAIQRYTMPS
jgi:hypothetical protein